MLRLEVEKTVCQEQFVRCVDTTITTYQVKQATLLGTSQNTVCTKEENNKQNILIFKQTMQRTTMDDAVTQVVRHQRNEDDVEEVQQNDIIEDGTTVGQAEAAMVDHPPSAHKVQETHYGTSSVAESGYYPSCSSDYSISSQSSYATTRPDSSDYCGSNGSIPMSTCSVSVSSHRDERQEQEVKTPVEIAFVAQPKKNQVTIDCSTKITHLSSDTMVNILTFLEPEEVVDVMTMPICKEWIKSYTTNCYIWRELCRLEPFKAKFCDMDDSDSTFIDDDSDYYSFCSLREVDACEEIRYMKFRSMYASFVTCMKYLRGIKEGKRNDQVSSETKLKDGQIRSYNTGIPTEEIQRTPNGVARSEYYLKKGTKKVRYKFMFEYAVVYATYGTFKSNVTLLPFSVQNNLFYQTRRRSHELRMVLIRVRSLRVHAASILL